MDLYPYPTEFTSAAGTLVRYLLKQAPPVDTKEVGHAAWQIVGYAMSQWDKHPPILGSWSQEVKLSSDEEMANILQQATMVQGDKESVPWSLIISIALEILKRFLGS